MTAGAAGIDKSSAPSASHSAFTTAAAAGTMPPSPAPLIPSGLPSVGSYMRSCRKRKFFSAPDMAAEFRVATPQ